MVTHHLSDLIPEMDRIILMEKGSVIAEGPKQEVKMRPITVPIKGCAG